MAEETVVDEKLQADAEAVVSEEKDEAAEVEKAEDMGEAAEAENAGAAEDSADTENAVHEDDTEDAEGAEDAGSEEPAGETNTARDYLSRLSAGEIEQEYMRVKTRQKRIRNTRRVLLGLATVSAVVILIAILFLPVLRTYGSSMTPTLYEGNILVSHKGADYKQGDIVSFYYNNTILVKRVIAFAGDWVIIDDNGVVSVNGKVLDEPYVEQLALGDCDLEFPYQVPDGSIFVMGDHRSTSKDSRNSSMGPIPESKVVGKILFRVWPLSQFGKIE